jgi:hypothetical protein
MPTWNKTSLSTSRCGVSGTPGMEPDAAHHAHSPSSDGRPAPATWPSGIGDA